MGFSVGGGICGGVGVTSPAGAGLVSAVSTVPCAATGKCAAPTTLDAVVIKAAIAGAITRLPGRRAAPSICGSARKPSDDSPLQPATISIIAGAKRLHHYRLVSIELDAEQVTQKRWKILPCAPTSVAS